MIGNIGTDMYKTGDSAVFPVVEHFISVNGEGRRAGQLALFIRFAGCNLKCGYCDTGWANEKDVPYEPFTMDLIIETIVSSGIKNVTLTGGEPLIRPEIKDLLEHMRTMRNIRVEVETNGSVDIEHFFSGKNDFMEDNVTFTVDYKTGASGMEQYMCMHNYRIVRPVDTVKFVVGSVSDIERAVQVIEEYDLRNKGCGIYISPCFGKIDPAMIVDYFTKEKLNDINLQLQLHKYIWDADARGV